MLSAIKLRNFKSFSNVELEFRKLNVLAGLNGAGKSTICQATSVVAQSISEGFLEKNKLILNGRLVELGTGADVLYDAAEEEVIGIAFDYKEKTYDISAEYAAESDVLSLNTKLSGKMTRINEFLSDGYQYLKADRIVPNTTYPKSHHVFGRGYFLGAQGEFTGHYLSQHRDDKVRSNRRHADHKKQPGLLTQVNAWMQEISPGVSLETSEIENTDLIRLTFSYPAKGVGGSVGFRPTNVGFGLTYTLPIVTAALSAPRGCVLMVENPEAHLHPDGQLAIARLLGRCAADGVQIIVETHSDHVLNGTRLNVKEGVVDHDDVRLKYFSKGEDPQAIVEDIRVDPDGRMEKWPEGFFDQWEKALDRLI